MAVLSLAILISLTATPAVDARAAQAPAVLDGQLIDLSSGAPTLKASKRVYPLSAAETYVLRTLKDKRLSGREIRVEGTLKADGTFEVAKFYAVHDGRLYRVRYYCETCNIVSAEPGRCVCCQQPTELQEVPVDGTDLDAIVIH